MTFFFFSISRSLKIGAVELSREKWDEATADGEGDEEDGMTVSMADRDRVSGVLPDWTKAPLPPGAPPAVPALRAPQTPVASQ
jgi:actin-related protein 10